MAVAVSELKVPAEEAVAMADKVVERWHGRRESMVEMLLDIQAEYNYLPREVLEPFAARMETPIAKVIEVASFYNAFSLIPKGKAKYNMVICNGTLCYVKGAPMIVDKFKQELGINDGEVTDDGLFGMETAACLGVCSLAPVMIINGDEVYGKLTTERVPKLIQELRGRAEAEANTKADDDW